MFTQPNGSKLGSNAAENGLPSPLQTSSRTGSEQWFIFGYVCIHQKILDVTATSHDLLFVVKHGFFGSSRKGFGLEGW